MRYDKKIKMQARSLYEKGLALKEVAEKLSLKESTIRSWKKREKWAQDCNVATERCVAKKQVQNITAGDEELTTQQELFCLLFSRSLNATKAYQEAYQCSYNSAMVSGSRLLKEPHIKKEVERLKKERYTLAYLSSEDIFQKYMDIAFADIGDYLEFNEIEVPVMVDGVPLVKDGEPLKTKKNIIILKDSKEVDTSLIQEVKEGREGVSVKLQDKMKALDWLASHMNMATEEQRAKVEKIKADTEKVNAEIANLKGLDVENEKVIILSNEEEMKAWLIENEGS